MAYILQQLLTRSAALYPDKSAVWARKRSLTYRELDERSTQLAHLLRQRGLKKGDRVGIFFPKCVESLVCMFGVLKAGGVYVPLDPQAPADRIGYIIENCEIHVLADEQRTPGSARAGSCELARLLRDDRRFGFERIRQQGCAVGDAGRISVGERRRKSC